MLLFKALVLLFGMSVVDVSSDFDSSLLSCSLHSGLLLVVLSVRDISYLEMSPVSGSLSNCFMNKRTTFS